MELGKTHHVLLASIGCASLLIYVLACTSFSPDDSQVLYPAFDQPSEAISIALYDRKSGLSETLFTATTPDLTVTNRTRFLTRAQWLPDGKHVLIAQINPKDDGKVSLFVIPHGVKDPVRQLGDLVMKSPSIMYPFSVAGSKLILNDDKALVRIDLITGQTLRFDYTNEVSLIPGGNSKTITAALTSNGKSDTVIGEVDPQTMAFTPQLTLTNACMSFPTVINLRERQLVFLTGDENKPRLQVVKNGAVTFSRTIESDSSSNKLACLGPGLEVGTPQDRVFTTYCRQVEHAEDAEYGIIEIPLNGEPLRWIPLFHTESAKNEDLLYAQVSLSHDGRTLAIATTYLYLVNKSLKPEDCALFLVEVNQAIPRITKIPIAPPAVREAP